MNDQDASKANFVDHARVVLRGGNGGDGSYSFRREKYVPRGGPDGGDGGKGGDIYLQANTHLRTLLDFARRPRFEAGAGEPGRGKNQFGHGGRDLVLDVPCGTVIFEKGEPVADLLTPGEKILVARGGEGGRGNVHFKNSVRQAPRIAERGMPGEKRELTLQLKLIADVGLIGMPNAGKSTLLSRLTRAHPKIAAYPFTTLSPNLGVTLYDNREIVFADIPGLIEGSHQGKGLGHEFLQHIERTRILVHVVDPLGFANKPPKENIKIVQGELKKYLPALAKKPEILVVNKQDLAEGQDVLKDVKRSLRRKKVLALSGVSGQGLAELLAEVARILDQAPPEKAPVKRDVKPVRIMQQPDFWVERQDERFVVRGKGVERLVLKTNFHLPDAVKRTEEILRKIGVERALFSRGAQPGDPIEIGGLGFTFNPEK